MALILTVTPEGRAALRNAQGDGTNAVRIAAVGVTASAFAPGAAVPAEIKRLGTIAGGATDATTMHVTITDAGSDVYSVRGFGFYLDDGTLFASYGQAGVIVEKSAQSIMQLAVDVQFADIDANAITFGDTNFNNPGATTERQGVSELATNAEAIAGTDTQRVVTPAALAAVLLAYLATTAKAGVVELATDAEAIAGTDAQRALTPANLAAVLAQFLATSAKPGAVELATNAEAITGTDAQRAITPANLAAVLAQFLATDANVGAVELATNAEAITGTDAQRALTPANLAAVLAQFLATTAKPGAVELATNAEAITGTDAQRALTPANLAAVLGQFLANDVKAGAVELATDLEVLQGTDTTRVLTPATALAGLLGAGNGSYVTIPYHDAVAGTRGNIIVQWLSGNGIATGPASLSFPITFPHACLSCVAVAANPAAYFACLTGALTASGFGINCWSVGGNRSTAAFFAIAVGY